MAVTKENFVSVELNGGNIYRSFVNQLIGEGDEKGDEFGAYVLDGGTPASLAGASCVGFFIRPDGITLVLNGQISGNRASVVLPEAAYAIPGNFTLAIKLGGTGFGNTIRIVDGTVIDTTTGEISDPASVVPSLADLMAVIEDAENAAAEIDSLSISATLISGTRYKIAVTIST